MNLLFLDCEWADVLASELVSIALVPLDGERVFYAERTALPEPTPWAAEAVYPRLSRGSTVMDDAAMTRALRAYLADFDEVSICYDHGANRAFCEAVLDGPESVDSEALGPRPREVRWDRVRDMGRALERWWRARPDSVRHRHHALMDAQALRGAWLSLWGF